MEREEIKTKAEEERYMKEERDKMALEMYENWLVSRITCGTGGALYLFLTQMVSLTLGVIYSIML